MTRRVICLRTDAMKDLVTALAIVLAAIATIVVLPLLGMPLLFVAGIMLFVYARQESPLFAWTGIFLVQIALAFTLGIAPELGAYAGAFLFLAVLGGATVRFSAEAAPFWVRMVHLVVLAEFVLSYGFANFSIGAGSAKAPFAELTLLLSLLWVALRAWRSLWVSGPVGLALLVYIVPATIFHLPIDLVRHGTVAARDYLTLLDALFFFAGLAVVGAAKDRALWMRWRHRFYWLLLMGALCYLPFYPLQQTILTFSPRVTGYQQSVPFFGYFTTANVLAVAGVLALVLTPTQFAFTPGRRPFHLLLVAAYLVFFSSLVIIQSRAGYIVFLLSMAVLALNGHAKATMKFLFLTVMGLIAIVAIDLSGIEIKGRLGNIGTEMISEQLESVTGAGGHAGGASGVHQRRQWWTQSLAIWLDSSQSVAIGAGFGIPLTNFMVAAADSRPVVVREPHNSYVSVLVRTGLVGFLGWAVFQVMLLTAIWRRFRSARAHDNEPEAGYWLWLLLLLISMLVVAFVEPVFESPWFAVPYFFLAGTSLGEMIRDRCNWTTDASLRGSGHRSSVREHGRNGPCPVQR